jgi:hypothetical protein
LGAGGNAKTAAKAGLGAVDYVVMDGLACAEDASVHTVATVCTEPGIGLGDILGPGDQVSSVELVHDLEGIAAARTAAADGVDMRKVVSGFFVRPVWFGWLW